MPLNRTGVRRAAAGLLALVAGLSFSSAAQATERIDVFGVPSLKGNVDPKKVVLNKVDSLNATVLVPDGYSDDPAKEWPVLYLFAGIGDNHRGWITSGQIHELAKDLPAIIVLPETGKGFLMDWWTGGSRKGPNWMRYMLDEVVPLIESKYRVRPGRQWHSVGGISMGGYGALLAAGQMPGYFGSVVSMSGLVDSQSLEAYIVLPIDMRAGSYDNVWGPLTSDYAKVSNPLKTIENIAHTRIYQHTGVGTVDPKLGFSLKPWTEGWAIEQFAYDENRRYDRALTKAGVAHTFVKRVGVHDWPYWRREVPRAISWGLFEPPPYATDASATSWSYKTMAPHGNAWGLGYKFAALPKKLATISRSGDTVTVTGSGTVTITPGAVEWDASGAGARAECAFTAQLPVTRTLPAGCLS